MKLASKFKTATVLGAVCAAFAVPAHAEFTGSAGLGVHVWDGGYRDTDAHVWPIPAVDVETDHFYFKGLEAGGFLVKTDAHRLMLGVAYMGLGFDAGDSDDARMKKLDDRDGSFFANVTYAWRSQLGQITASIGADISGKSEGFMSDVSWMKRFDVAGFGVTPQVGVLFTSEKFNDYYYGISHAESKRSGLDAYSADAGVSPYFRLIGDYRISEKFSVYAEGTVRSLSKEIKDSPMVDGDIAYGFGAGVSYHF